MLNNPKNKVVYDKEKDGSQGTSGSIVPSVLNDPPFYEGIVPQTPEVVKRNFSESDTENSDTRDQKKQISNRDLLANALESAVQNDIERNKLAQYKSKLATIELERAKLADVRQQASDLRFKKGRTAEETKALKSLDFEANQIANCINTYDRQLFALEATSALKGVLQREKELVCKRTEEKGREALDAYREKMTKTQRELLSLVILFSSFFCIPPESSRLSD